MSEIRGLKEAQEQYEGRLPHDVSRIKPRKHKDRCLDDEPVDWDRLRDELDDRNRY